ncbi:MAG: energy-coupling factor transporter ATPase [Clostridia bacterium]|nr:energy-coupling factor transporter ATPase [Clostridia bacterium]
MQIVAKDLTYIYSEKSKSLAVRAVDGVTLTIDEGEFFGIVGRTGSGKSTFVQHLNGLIKVGKDKGSLKIGEFDLTDKDCDFMALRSKVGMVFQYPEAQLFAETVFDDVAFGLKNFYPELSPEETTERVKTALTLVGLNYEEVKEKSPFELSGGQKRRVAIAGVIVTRPEVLVLDEPAAGLDPVGKRDFIRLLKELHKTFVKTIIIVSHDMNLVSENCSRAVVFDKGKIALSGTPKEIFSDAKKVAELGLDLPVTAKLTNDLKDKGIIIDSDLTTDDFIQKYLRAVKDKGGAL